jgi:hypothetical protein
MSAARRKILCVISRSVRGVRTGHGAAAPTRAIVISQRRLSIGRAKRAQEESLRVRLGPKVEFGWHHGVAPLRRDVCARRDGCQTYNGGDRGSSAPEKGVALSLPRRMYVAIGGPWPASLRIHTRNVFVICKSSLLLRCNSSKQMDGRDESVPFQDWVHDRPLGKCCDNLHRFFF